MIKLIIGFVLATGLTFGTLFVNDESVELYACGLACDATVDVDRKGFPFAYLNDEPVSFTELEGVFEDDWVESRFSVANFAMSLVFWFGVVAILYMFTKTVLTRFGIAAAVGLGALYSAGYIGVLTGL